MRADGGGRVRVRIAMILRLSVSDRVQNLPRHVRIKATVSGYSRFTGSFRYLSLRRLGAALFSFSAGVVLMLAI